MGLTIRKTAVGLAIVLVMLVCANREVRAGTILFGTSETEGGSTVVIGEPRGSVVPVSKVFRTLDPISITYVVMNSGGTTKDLFSDTVFNQTGRDWTDYHIDLGFTTTITQRDPITGELTTIDIFLPAGPPLDFAKNPTPTARRFGMDVFGRLTLESDSIDWSMGTLRAGASANFTFSMDIPDFVEGIPTEIHEPTTGATFGYSFTLRQQPTIPEPCTLLLLGSSLTGIALARERIARNDASRRDT